ncbi:GNAT family N-acetyltransferase [Nitrospira sp. BLG_2]|uniref:GNAT family N-acetyltransferase n=1 Tax=Nitrospira sp. BLG_2 TaxID=3397507 RepID=UPI003B9B116F
MTANNPVTYNEAQQRYEMPIGNLVVYADVRRDTNTLYIDYVFAPQELRGKGAAGEFMGKLMDVVRAQKLKAVPICGYAAGWLRRHSEYQDLVSD